VTFNDSDKGGTMIRYLLAFSMILSLAAPASAQAAGCDAQLKKPHDIQMQRMAAQADKIKQSVKDAAKAGEEISRVYFGYINALVRRGNDPKNLPCVIEQLSDASGAAQKATQVAAAPPKPVPPKPGTPPAVAGVKLLPAAMALAKAKIIAPPQGVRHGTAFGYGFWIAPRAAVPGWASILHKGRSDKERAPAIFFHPNSTRLHVRVDTATKMNDGCDAKTDLPGGKWSHVFVQFRPGLAEVFVDGKLHNRCRIGGPVRMNGGPLFAGNPWHVPASAGIRDVQLFTQPLLPAQVAELVRTTATQPGGLHKFPFVGPFPRPKP
jgi:hypothetical protein